MLQHEVPMPVGHVPQTASMERAPVPTQGTLPCPFPLDVGTGLPAVLAGSASPPAPSEPLVPCAWAVCSDTADGLEYMYLDPRASRELAGMAPKLRHRSLLDFVCPDDRPRIHIQLRNMTQTRTLFGSVIRCRYASITGMRAALHGSPPVEHAITDIVVNRMGPQLSLCFFHQVEPAVGAPGCGLPPGSLGLADIHELWNELCRTPFRASEPVSYVFQVLSTTLPRQVLLSWPPPTSYNACDFAKLAQHANIKPSATCTERLHASHTLSVAGHTRTADSVLVPCGSILLACFYLLPTESSKAAPVSVNSLLAQARTPVPPPSALLSAPAGPQKTQPVSITPQQSRTEEALVSSISEPVKRCTSCGRKDSPEWRRGPSGHKTRSSSEPDTEPSGNDFDHRLASVLASMPHNARFATRSEVAPMAGAPMNQMHPYSPPPAPPAEVAAPLSIKSPTASDLSMSASLPMPATSGASATLPVPIASPLPSPNSLSPAYIPFKGRSVSAGSSPISSALVPGVMSYPLSVPMSAPPLSPSSPTTPTTGSFHASSLPNIFPTSPLPTVPAPTSPLPTVPAPTSPLPTVPAPTSPLPTVSAPAAPSGPAPSVVVSTDPMTLMSEPTDPLKAASGLPMDPLSAATALSALQSPTIPIVPPATTATVPPVTPTSPFSSMPSAEEAALP
ncbi:hypothetical protein MCAP1_001744 [Malassezia caprae]|uniref:GATA-type domain-containing protein n=1 Tax=Malassezia caprae TaxID=1381934 RepID=A0AAF0E4T8_9BASI|nr:hypothetical protein MCAP1_001744 [Malassezia caprae]